FYRVNSALDAKHQGAGLGLPFAKSIVELHSGKLAIESKIGCGTTVTITLPLPSRVADAVAGRLCKLHVKRRSGVSPTRPKQSPPRPSSLRQSHRVKSRRRRPESRGRSP